MDEDTASEASTLIGSRKRKSSKKKKASRKKKEKTSSENRKWTEKEVEEVIQFMKETILANKEIEVRS